VETRELEGIRGVLRRVGRATCALRLRLQSLLLC